MNSNTQVLNGVTFKVDDARMTIEALIPSRCVISLTSGRAVDTGDRWIVIATLGAENWEIRSQLRNQFPDAYDKLTTEDRFLWACEVNKMLSF